MFSFLKKKPRDIRYHSSFGGLWVDRLDADEELSRRLSSGAVSPELGRGLSRFMADGYLIVPGAVDSKVVDRIAAAMTHAFERGDERLRYQGNSDEVHVFQGNTDPRGKRVVEAHAVLPDVRDAFAAPAVVEFLTALFDEPPVLSQSLMFQMGSEQPIHRDTTFVRFDKPLCMVGCWIALEDVRPGSGELSYIVGSHRLPDFPFSTGRKDGVEATPDELHASFGWLVTESEKRGLSKQVFRASKGDALFWHADLAHGGSPITDPRLTRQSLVGHLSPLSVGRSTFATSAKRRRHGALYYSSTYYDLAR